MSTFEGEFELNEYSKNLANYHHEGIAPTEIFIITSLDPDRLIEASVDIIMQSLTQLIPAAQISFVIGTEVRDSRGKTVTLLDPFTVVLDMRYPGPNFRLLVLTVASDRAMLKVH